MLFQQTPLRLIAFLTLANQIPRKTDIPDIMQQCPGPQMLIERRVYTTFNGNDQRQDRGIQRMGPQRTIELFHFKKGAMENEFVPGTQHLM